MNKKISFFLALLLGLATLKDAHGFHLKSADESNLGSLAGAAGHAFYNAANRASYAVSHGTNAMAGAIGKVTPSSVTNYVAPVWDTINHYTDRSVISKAIYDNTGYSPLPRHLDDERFQQGIYPGKDGAALKWAGYGLLAWGGVSLLRGLWKHGKEAWENREKGQCEKDEECGKGKTKKEKTIARSFWNAGKFGVKTVGKTVAEPILEAGKYAYNRNIGMVKDFANYISAPWQTSFNPMKQLGKKTDGLSGFVKGVADVATLPARLLNPYAAARLVMGMGGKAAMGAGRKKSAEQPSA